ncbi:hypothetical protein D3C84_770830 [compost metagenome]
MEHGADGAFDPDAGVDMDDDAEDQHQRGEGMQQGGEADQFDAEEVAEVLAPDHHAGQQQHQHAKQQHPEQQLLPGVVAADFGQSVLAVADHVLPLFQPLAVGFFPAVVPGETHGQPDEEEEHGHAEERMQDARPGAAAEEVAQPEQGRVEQRQAGEPGEYEEDGHRPVVAAFGGGVAFDVFVHVRLLAGRASLTPALSQRERGRLSQLGALGSDLRTGVSSSSTLFGPTRT